MAASKANLARLASQGLAPPNLMGVWTNEIGSIMTITVVNGANFSGTYESDDGQGGRIRGTLSGISSGETLGWTVSWQPVVDSTTSWTGKFLVDKLTNKIDIYTLWYLSSGDAVVPLWDSFSAGQDTFWQLP
ncbi:MAG: avidin/streptavidin family protein [Caulobacteraceae bacterium]